MLFSKAVISTIFVTTALATCNGSGTEANAEDVKDLVHTVCKVFAGTFWKDQYRTMCVMDKAQKKWDFQLKACPSKPSPLVALLTVSHVVRRKRFHATDGSY
jgi:hypothetical protein